MKITDILKQSALTSMDPVLVLSNGYIIETFSTSTLEPWNITLDNTSFFADPANQLWTADNQNKSIM